MSAYPTPFGVLSFPNLFTARAPVEGSDPRFSLNLVFDKEAQETAEFKALKDAIRQCAVDKWGNNMPKNLRNPIRDASEKDYDGYDDGKVFINAWTKNPPGVVGPTREDILDPKDVWAGQLARATVKPFAYDTSGNKGVALGLENVQIGKFDMPRLDGRVSAKAAFDDADIAGDVSGNDADGSDDSDPFA